MRRDAFKKAVNISWLGNFGWFALFGGILFVASLFVADDRLKTAFLLSGVLLMLPALIHLNFVTVWHWGIRYKGEHRLLWGAILFIETGGWLKIFYFFRHVLPDLKRKGRYAFADREDLNA